jgi:hypothetical protein
LAGEPVAEAVLSLTMNDRGQLGYLAVRTLECCKVRTSLEQMGLSLDEFCFSMVKAP